MAEQVKEGQYQGYWRLKPVWREDAWKGGENGVSVKNEVKEEGDVKPDIDEDDDENEDDLEEVM